jgi:glutamine amidotransferase-like uncharacterized protein
MAHDALVWGGPGACPEDCTTASVHVAQMAGYDPMIVTPENYDPTIFETAKVWIQPGGKSGSASLAMGPSIRNALKKFIENGGGYVGFCAGAFLTTPKVGATRIAGLGIVDGKTKPFRNSSSHVSLQALTTDNGTIYQYWEGGPYFKLTSSQLKKVKVLSRYESTNQINALETTFGKGRISISGTHPEAPQWWFDDGGLRDNDGLDNEYAAQMVRWAAKKE